MMNSTIAALRIGRGLTASENGVDTTIAELGALVTELARARTETGSPVVTGQRALARVAAALSKQVEARMDIIRAHEDLRRIAEAGNMPTDCPEETFTSAELDEASRRAA